MRRREKDKSQLVTDNSGMSWLENRSSMTKGIVMTSSGLMLLTLLTGILLSSEVARAEDSVVSTASITVPISCTMTGAGTAHTATLNPGTYSGASGSEYENGIGKTTLTAICNDDNGFSIYAIGYTGNQYSGENHTKLVGANTGGAITTKAYQSEDTTSNWSMKLTKVTNTSESYNPQNLTLATGYDTWHEIPAEYTKVAQYKANTGSSTTDTTLGVKLETTYAAYIASNQPADTYIGQVKYTMVHPYTEEPLQPQTPTAGCINYFANAGDAVGTMGCHSEYDNGYGYINITDGSSVELLASNYSRTGYGFAGWSDKFDYATNPNAKFYGPQETITVPEGTAANGFSLYAVWIKSQGSIQDQDKVASVCNSLTTAPTDGTANLSSVSAFTDSRDNNTYAVAKLADGKCWMIENLRLSNTNSDNSAGRLAQGYDSSFVGLANPESAQFGNSTTANSLYSIDETTAIKISGSYQGRRFPRYNDFNTGQRSSYPTNDRDSFYTDGNYYTWHAAIADTTHYISGDHSNNSICPNGWRIPQGNTTTSGFGKLDIDLGGTGMEQRTRTASNRWRKYPTNFITSGYIDGSKVQTGIYGDYWSSTARGDDEVFGLFLDRSSVLPGTYSMYKSEGYSIRCTVSAGT